MQGRQFITTTNLDDFHALAWQGAKAYASFEQLRRLLFSRLSPEHAALFAEPLPDDVRRKADWYFLPGTPDGEQAPAQPVQPARLLDLPAEIQHPVREKLLALGRDIYNLSQELKQSPDSNQHTAGNLLEMALTFPGEEYIYVVADASLPTAVPTPVLVAWGFSSSSGGAQPEMLTRLRQSPATLAGAFTTSPAPTGPIVHTQASAAGNTNYETRVHRLSLPWVLLAFLLGALLCGILLYFLGPRLGLNFGGFGLGGCSRQIESHNSTTHNATQAPSEELLRAQTLEYSLRAELERLRQELLARLAECERNENLPEIPIAPDEPSIEEPFAEEPVEEIPEIPDFPLPEIPEEPPLEEPVEEPPAAPAEEPNNMEIPDQPENMDFLQGCWNAPTGLINLDTNQPVIVEYCFDDSGQGKVRITELDRNGKPRRTCEGDARANLNGDQLAIEDDGAICTDNSLYYGNRVICYKDEKGNTVCKGNPKEGPKNEWGPVPFMDNQE